MKKLLTIVLLLISEFMFSQSLETEFSSPKYFKIKKAEYVATGKKCKEEYTSIAILSYSEVIIFDEVAYKISYKDFTKDSCVRYQSSGGNGLFIYVVFYLKDGQYSAIVSGGVKNISVKLTLKEE